MVDDFPNPGEPVSPLQEIRASDSCSSAVLLMACEYANLGYVVIRGKADDESFMSAAASVLGNRLPVVPRALVRTPAGVVLWQSPDEWWLVCARADRENIVKSLCDVLQGCYAQVVENSGGFTAMHIRGGDLMTLLRHLSPYDFESLKQEQCVSTVIGKASFTVIRIGTAGATLVFRRSFATYIWDLLDRAALPYGIKLVQAKSAPDGLFSPLLATNATWSSPVACVNVPAA